MKCQRNKTNLLETNCDSDGEEKLSNYVTTVKKKHGNKIRVASDREKNNLKIKRSFEKGELGEIIEFWFHKMCWRTSSFLD